MVCTARSLQSGKAPRRQDKTPTKRSRNDKERSRKDNQEAIAISADDDTDDEDDDVQPPKKKKKTAKTAKKPPATSTSTGDTAGDDSGDATATDGEDRPPLPSGGKIIIVMENTVGNVTKCGGGQVMDDELLFPEALYDSKVLAARLKAHFAAHSV